MLSLITTSIALLSLASTSVAATVGVVNHCNENVYLTIADASQVSQQYNITVNGNYSQPLVGTNNQFGISKSSDYYAATTAKFIFGYSDDTADALTYWSVSNLNGDPLTGGAGEGGFAVIPSDSSCANTTTYDNKVYTCVDTVRNFWNDTLLHMLISLRPASMSTSARRIRH